MMFRTGAAVLSLSLLIVPAAGAAPAKASKKLTPPKPIRPAVKGTTQLAGDNAQIGLPYTVGKSSPLNFTLTEAEYSISRVNESDNAIAPLAEEKLLVLRYTVQNPNPFETDCNWDSLHLTVVDASNDNHEPEGVLHAGTGQRLLMNLKPAQKVGIVAAFRVPARGDVPKLIVARSAAEPVLRYDLRGKVKPLPAPFAAPEDPSGASARADVPAETGQYYPLLEFDVKLVSAAYADSPVGTQETSEERRFLVAVFSLKNQRRLPTEYSCHFFRARLRASDGEKTEARVILKGARDELAQGSLEPGEEANMRVLFELPRGVAAQNLFFALGESRGYTFDLKF